MDVLSYWLEDSSQFWDELKDIASGDYHSTSRIDQALTAYLKLASMYMDKYLVEDEDITRCAYDLINSSIYSKSRAFARRKLISLLVLDHEDMELPDRVLVGAVLLVDGRLHKSTLEMLQEESAIRPVILTILQDRYANVRIQRIYLELFYEMCRVQKIALHDLEDVSVEFAEYLFSLVEHKEGYDTTDPYNLAAMKVLLALNEQYMIAELEHTDTHDNYSYEEEGATTPHVCIENKMFAVLCMASDRFRSFGENLVFIFNRCADKCLQLMIMKFLYLVFTTRETYQYLYLNDLKVLVSVIVRELYDLSQEEENLRNAYLRILHPLLQNTQIGQDRYKRSELVAVLDVITNPSSSSAFLVSETTRRLAYRCLKVDWLDYISPTISPVDSISDLDSEDVSAATTPTTDPAMMPPPLSRRQLGMEIRNDSVAEIATLSKTATPPPSSRPQRTQRTLSDERASTATPPPPLPPRSYMLRHHSASEIAKLAKSSTPPPPPPPRPNRHTRGLDPDRVQTPPPPPPPRIRIGTPFV